ncbi:MAG: hypothetical protein K1X53_03175 [Candidatus Sumerlaeaceae bacterium]|nr:hypothetical protein [Candidatus Sumerlaeaceae bacterium]
MEQVQTTGSKAMSRAERIIVGFIVVSATFCAGLILAYLVMFDARGVLN